MEQDLKAVLAKYVPESALDLVAAWVTDYRIRLRIARTRRTKLGDYRPPLKKGQPHRISINHNLNPYAFLITFIHELAHLVVHETYKNRVKAHGREWKQTYRRLMEVVLSREIFPDDIRQPLAKSIVNAKASSSAELELSRALRRYDSEPSGTSVEDLAEGSIFRTQSGMRFRKGARQRTRYKCLNLQNNRYYLFHPLTPVELLEG